MKSSSFAGKEMSIVKNNSSHYGSNSATRYRVDRIEKLEGELEELLKFLQFGILI